MVNECGELLAFMITAGNYNDRKAILSPSEDIFGKIFGDKGYISSELGEILLEKGIQFITKLKLNMKNK
ncbi:MAG: transposase [Chlamydia sp.]